MFKRVSLVITVFLLITSCQQSPFQVDLQKNIALESVRFDQKLMSLDSNQIESSIEQFYKEDPLFFPAYTHRILKIGGREQQNFKPQLLSFIYNDISQSVYASICKKFKNVDDISKAVSKAYSYYHYYFPSEEIPKLYYFQSGFNQRIVIDSLLIGIGLDMCLGTDCEYYDQLGIPNYMQNKLGKETIAVDAMKGLAWSNFPFEGNDNLACNMIYEGKIQYLITALFPNVADSIKFAYSNADLAWLERNEANIWASIIEDEMLYVTERIKIQNMIGNAPFSQPFGNQSPPKIGIWIGYKIVKSYMDTHPKVSIPDLMQMQDYVGILNDSGYNP